jgi:radical SAM protein with 4Fe4S-binding SPASM domain
VKPDQDDSDTGVIRARDLGDAYHWRIVGDEPPVAPVPQAKLDEFRARVDRLARRAGLFEKLEIELSLGCNRRCTYCFLATERRQNHLQTRARTMPWELYELLLAQLAELAFTGVLCFHFYNEPLLHRDLHRYVAAARDRLPAVTVIIYSNGDLLDTARYHELISAGVNVLFVTRHDNAIPPALAAVLRMPGVMLDTRADMELNNRGGYLGPPIVEAVRELPCVFPSETAVITLEGNVLPCSCDFRETTRFGNIRDQHLRDIYFSPRAVAFRRSLLEGRRTDHALCKDCDYYASVLGAASAAEPHRHREQPLIPLRRLGRGPTGAAP